MENALKRLNTLFFIGSTIFGIYAVYFYLSPWSEYNANETLFGFGHGKVPPFAIVIGSLFPIAYCFLAATVSWILGSGFKVHLRLK